MLELFPADILQQGMKETKLTLSTMHIWIRIMKATWASGSIELLKHADSHIDLDTAFDKRIAFISIDNCVETIIRTYISLPKSKSGIKVKYHDCPGNN